MEIAGKIQAPWVKSKNHFKRLRQKRKDNGAQSGTNVLALNLSSMPQSNSLRCGLVRWVLLAFLDTFELIGPKKERKPNTAKVFNE